MTLFKRYKTRSDEELMALAQKGEQGALNEIYGRYSKPLLHFMYRMLGHDDALAQDLLHDVFIRILEEPKRFDAERNFKSWIYTVCANECRKHHRSHVPMDDLGDAGALLADTYGTDKADQKAFRKALRLELQKLSYEHRCTFILRFQENFEVVHVAQIMNCSEGTVKSRSHYCLKILAKALASFNPINTI